MARPDIFRIGELSSLFNISVDSIRYYEKMGLLHPRRNEDNGYREYSLDDFQSIVMIRELLGLGFHMNQIEEFLKNRSVDSTLALLNEEISIINEMMLTLYEKKNSIQSRLLMVQQALLVVPDEQVHLKHFPKRPAVMISDTNLPDAYVDYHMIKFMKHSKKDINTIGYCDCYTLDLEGSNPKSDLYRTENVFFLSEILPAESNYALEEGDYLSLTYRGAYTKTKQLMYKLFDYAKEHDLTITGHPIEISHIDEYETSDMREYIIEIQLPVSADATIKQ